MSATTYLYGYQGTRLTLEAMRAKSGIAKIDPEMWRRLVALMEAARVAGVDLGIGGSWRSSDNQLAGFLNRHAEVASGGCCGYGGKRYALKPGNAHMAPPGRSYHESTTPAGHCLAVDMVSNDAHRWMNANCHRFGLVHFANVNKEPWHVQPTELPSRRADYRAATHHPLKPFALPTPAPAPAPTPAPNDDLAALGRAIEHAKTFILRVGSGGPNATSDERGAVIWCQTFLQMHGFYKGYKVDGSYGNVTATEVKKFQTSKKLFVDGVVGRQTWTALAG
jgi:hypothetical protein